MPLLFIKFVFGIHKRIINCPLGRISKNKEEEYL
jgi:hypothetical protein